MGVQSYSATQVQEADSQQVMVHPVELPHAPEWQAFELSASK